MIKVITYGTYDFLHYGHIRLLERAKALGDYLIVGITTDDFDMVRGKINVQQSLMERMEAVRATGIADEIIIEEYEGQKIDDIRKYDIDIFTVGSDWIGKFDYLKAYCKVVYLERTEGISSSEIRKEKKKIKLGLIGDSVFLNKVYEESKYVNGISVSGVFTNKKYMMNQELSSKFVDSYDNLLEQSDAIYIRSLPEKHFSHIKTALDHGKHVLCESPISLIMDESKNLFSEANKKKLILMEAIKTAYSTAFSRMLLLIKGGMIGRIISVDSVCTSLSKDKTDWPGIYEWAPTALLPIYEILGNEEKHTIISHYDKDGKDMFTKIEFLFEDAVASIKVGNGIKSEGELIISGTKGYIYVPAPWWKTDYFEIRYEDQNNNKRYFYQLDGEGIRYELVAFKRAIETGKDCPNINLNTTLSIVKILEDYTKKNVIKI